MADLNDGSSPTVKSSAAESFAENANAPDNSSKLIDRISHPVFIFAYLANLAVVTANAAMFMFADWVAWLATHGGSDIVYVEELPGRIVREGLIAAICARVFLGMSIDRFGVRHVWLCMSLTALCGACVFGSLQELTWLVYVGRVCFAVGLAGMFTCSTFHMQDSVAEHRRTEFIALLGSSGFLGMILGSQLAGFFRRSSGVNKEVYFANVFFAVTSLLLIYILLMWFATSDSVKPPKKTTRPTLLKLTWQYWPGFVLFVAMTMGMMFTVTSLYLVRFNRHAGTGDIAVFWTTYAVAAFLFRMKTASLSHRIGRYRLITVGLVAQGLGIWALIPVQEWWHLTFSAVICGLGHALLFPSIVSLGSGTFPPQYRGSGTNLTLGCFDLGGAVSAPLLGRIIDLPQFDGVGFRPMFFTAGLIPLIVATIWFATHRYSTDIEIRAKA
ncbi:MAG: MFS transporter [Fuerstiella sp.]